MPDEPERPTCRTCPFWDEIAPEVDGDRIGECRRYPPRMPRTEVQEETAEEFSTGPCGGLFPETLVEYWCGEHPDFSTFLAARRGETPGTLALSARDADRFLAALDRDAKASEALRQAFKLHRETTEPTSDLLKIGDVVQIDPTVSSLGLFAVVVGFDGDYIILKGADAKRRHHMHPRWCQRIGEAVWNPEELLAHMGIEPKD